MKGRSFIGLAGALASACSLAPRYHPPSTPAPAATYQEAAEWKTAQPMDDVSRGEWWHAFNDPALDAVEAKVADANQDIKAAFARLMQARAATRIARSSLLPTLSAQAAASRARTSVNAPHFPPGTEPTVNNFDVEADLSYEIDLWGRVRNNVASAKASQQASAADLGALSLAIRAEAATDYFSLCAEDAEQELLDRTVEDYRKSAELTQNLFHGGGAALSDVAQAQAQLESARTQAADIRLQRAQTEHALAVLEGENPTGFRLPVKPLPPGIGPPSVGVGLPSDLLERRPDVSAAERRAAAANAQIGVARAAYFPVFSLAAATGFDSTTTSNWITAPSRMWSAGPTGMLTIFDFGRHRAQSAQAHAAYDEQAANYRNTVLTAYQEVEDNLAALRQLEQESVSESAAVAATGQALQQAQYRYRAGLVTFLEVATTENTALQAQLSSVNIQLRRLTASVLLIKALGGGWGVDQAHQANAN
ncbi:MAG TPA: efflux transporter outer membrane subunit [Steroidobacteraceae bacterium]